MRSLYEYIQESTVDFPQEGLDLSVWSKNGDTYVLREDVQKKILAYISKYPGAELRRLFGELHIIGSMATNLYSEDTDIDVHIVPDEDKLAAVTDDAEEFQKQVKKWSHDNPTYIGKHPLEIYIQLIPEQEMLSDGVYDVIDDSWVKGPREYPLEYNPYKVFSDVLGQVRGYAEKADIKMGELKRDVVDYKTLQDAMGKLPKEYREALKKELEVKLGEVETDIEALMKDKKEWVDLRRGSSRPTAQQAFDDAEVVKKWKNSNALFKFLDRYEYVKIITELERMLDDGYLSNDELSTINNMLGNKQS
jgi:DNA-binding ferritin-like protein (Dps family)